MLYTLFVILALLALPPAQDTSTTIFFVARGDSSGDGLIDLNDENRLYTSTDGGPAIAVTQSGINVVQYTTRPDGALASYSWREGEQTLIETIQLADQTILSRVQVGDLQNIRLNLYESGLWIVGTNADNLPVIRGVDPLTGQQISERVMRRPDTQTEIHLSGNWILAYHLEAGALSVLQIPSLEGVPFEVSGYASGRPAWSPVGETLLIGSRSTDNPNDLGVLVVDLTTLSTTRYDLPDYPVETNVELSWSTHGQYIQILADTPAGNAALPSLAFLRIADGVLLPVTTEQIELVWEWALQDAMAIVSEGISVSESQQIGLTFDVYDPAQNALRGIPAAADYQTFNMHWNPAGTTLAMLAQSSQSGLYGLYVFDQAAAPGEVTTYFETTNARLSQGRLDWSADGSKIFFVVPTDSMIFTSLGLTWATFVLDLNTQTVSRISPEDSIVDILQVHIR
jgi:hypothetical protein